MKQYWLMKSEPNEYSIEDLKADRWTGWDGVRNYQARNFMRDKMRVGDGVFFYHSNVKPPEGVGIAGRAKVVKKGYPDDSAWNPKDKHYDPKSEQDNPIWYRVDVQFVKMCKSVISLRQLKTISELGKMVVVQKGSRLSVQPVSREEWDIILQLPEWG